MEWARSQNVHQVSKEAIQDFIKYFHSNPQNKQGRITADNTMKSMIKALRYRFVQCEGYATNLIKSWKGNTLVNKHIAYKKEDLKAIREVCKDNTEMSLAIELLYEMAGRIQDIALLHWSAITEIKRGENAGYADVYLKKLKSTDRDVQISPKTLDKLKAFKKLRGFRDDGWPDSQVFDTPNAHAMK